MKKTALFVIALFLCILLFGLFINRSYATEVTVFEGTFTRDTGAPTQLSKTFHAASGLATVNLTNDGISSARVVINGADVFKPNDFNQNVISIEKTVVLSAGENTLSVLLSSGPEGTIRIQIHMPLDIGITLDEANKASSTVTPEGGTITTQGADGVKFTLTFPSGALANTEEITLTPVSSISGLPLSGGMVAAVKMQPEGLNLATYATLTVELPQAPQNHLTGFFLYDSGDGFYAAPTKVQGNKATLQLTHFTIGGWGPVDCIDLTMLNSIHGATPEQTAKAQMATLEVSYDLCGSISFDESDRLVQDIHRDWYVAPGGVGQALAHAEADPQVYLRKAVAQLNSWYHSYSYSWIVENANTLPLVPPIPCPCLYGSMCTCSTLDELADSAAFSVKRALVKAVKQDDAKCSEYAVLSWFDLADSLDELQMYENSGTTLFDEQLVALKTCGVVSLAMNSPTKTIEVGESFEIKVEGRTQSGAPATLPREPGWGDTKQTVASCVLSAQDTATVTGQSPGEAKIWAAIFTTSGGSIWDAESVVTVTPGVKTLQVIALGKDHIVGTPVHFQVKAFDADGAQMQIDGSKVKWSATPTVESLIPVTGLSTTLVSNQVGSVTVTATYKDGLKTASNTICIRAAIGSIEVTPANKALFVGDSVHLTATAKTESGSTDFGCEFSPDFKWYSGNQYVAVVDSSGNVEAVSKGGAYVSAVYGSKYGYSHITVFDMTGTWLHRENWESSSCGGISYEVATVVVNQTGSALTAFFNGVYYTGYFSGPSFTWTLAAPYYLSQYVYITSSTMTGTVSANGLHFVTSDSWTASYQDQNGNWQPCGGFSTASADRL